MTDPKPPSSDAFLSEQDRRLRAVFAHAYEFIGVLSPDGILLDANDSALAFVGASRADVVGQPFWDTPWWSASPDRTRLRQAIHEAAGGAQVRFPTQHVDRHGRVAHVDFSLSPARDETGQVRYLIPEGRDVTELRRALDTASTSEANLATVLVEHRAIVETTAVGMSQADAVTGRFLIANAAYCAMVGRTEPQLRALTVSDITLPSEQAALRKRFDDIVRGEVAGADAETQYVRPDGTVVWALVSANPIKDATGRVVRVAAVAVDITARKHTEWALRESEQRFATLANLAPVGISRADPVGRVTYVNAHVLALTGRSPDQLGGMGWTECVHSDDLARVLQAIPHVPSNPSARDLEFRVMRLDGRVVWVRCRLALETDASGNVTGLIGALSDITAAKQADEALLEQHEQRLLETAAQGVLSVDPQGVIMTANPTAHRLFGYAAGTLVGRAVDELVPPDLRARHASHRTDYLKAPRARPMGLGLELVAQRRDGSTFPVEISLNQVTTDAGTRTVAFVTDITERHRASTALRESEQRLRLVLDASEAGTWSWDRRSNESTWDRRFHGQYGVAPNDTPTFQAWLGRVLADDRHLVLERLEQIQRTPGDDDWDIEFRVVRPDGAVVWMHSLGKAERDAKGQVVRLAGINLDITDRKRAEAALRERTDELTRRTRQLRRLASDLTLTEQSAREQLAKVLHDHLQQLLFSASLKLDRAIGHAGADTSLLERARADVQEAIAESRSLSVELFPPALRTGGLSAALEWLATWARDKYDVTLDVSVDPRANPERDDVRVLLFESVRELVFNAVKHAQVRRMGVSLTLEAGDVARISVVDEGPGFDPQEALGSASDHPGLGLFNIRERLALLGGEFLVDSAPGQGARFTLSVPRSSTAGPEVPVTGVNLPGGAAGTASGSTAPVTGRALRVLIVDDHAVVREGLRELFSDRPELQVVGEAADGAHAVAQAHALHPDVVVMDVSMPILDGVEATRRIRAELPRVLVFGLSTQEQTDRLHAIEEAGASGYFSKGEGAHQLVARLLAEYATKRGPEVAPT